MTILRALFILAGALALVWLLLWARRRARRRRRSQVRELVRLCHGDEEQVRRLINAQKRRHGLSSDEAAARRAVLAIRRDRR